MMSREAQGEEQTGRGGETTRACWPAAAGGQESAGSRAPARRTAADRIPLARRAQSQWHRCVARHEQGRTAAATGRGGIVAATCGAARRRSGHGFATPLWTLNRVRQWIEREFGVRYSEVHVWRLLGQQGLSNQKPDQRALERDSAAIEHWRKRTWSALKKTPLAKEDCSPSSTSPGSFTELRHTLRGKLKSAQRRSEN